jgi:hypothetical protein
LLRLLGRELLVFAISSLELVVLAGEIDRVLRDSTRGVVQGEEFLVGTG